MSPYLWRTFTGEIVRTILRGVTVCREGKIASEPVGRLITPNRQDVGVTPSQ